MKDREYHSALMRPIFAKPEAGPVQIGENVALQHDLLSSDRLPPAFDDCGAIYSEPPWSAGQAKFDRRAGVKDDRTHADVIDRIGSMILADDRPWVMIVEKRVAKALPDEGKSLHRARFSVHGGETTIVAYRAALPSMEETDDAVRILAERYGRVGDPMCGYGRTGMIVQAHGGTWVLSDYNAMCIGFIAQHARNWPTTP